LICVLSFFFICSLLLLFGCVQQCTAMHDHIRNFNKVTDNKIKYSEPDLE
jgi:hypothetical protein